MSPVNESAVRAAPALARLPRWLRQTSGSLWLAALVVLLPLWVVPGYFAARPAFSNCWTRAPLVTPTGEVFGVDRFVGTSGENVRVGDKVCGQNLQLAGVAAPAKTGTRLRLFNVGAQGELFVHEPPLEVVDGRWSTDKVGPGANIREIRFVLVSESTSTRLSDMARNGDWLAGSLPMDSHTVASIRLIPDPVCAAWDARQCAP